jgi:hypothetical protein
VVDQHKHKKEVHVEYHCTLQEAWVELVMFDSDGHAPIVPLALLESLLHELPVLPVQKLSIVAPLLNRFVHSTTALRHS